MRRIRPQRLRGFKNPPYDNPQPTISTCQGILDN
jgi:hypothetical protein